MRRATSLIAVLGLALLMGCATPEVAEDYQETSLVPAELEAALRSDDPTRRAEASTQIESMEASQRKVVLMELAGADRAATRMMAVNLLAQKHLPDAEVTGRLTDVLSLDSDVDVRISAVNALAGCGETRGLEAILEALSNDSSLMVKREAAVVMDRLTGQSFGQEIATKVEDAEMASDDAMMSYDDWFSTNKANLRWDISRSRFVTR